MLLVMVSCSKDDSEESSQVIIKSNELKSVDGYAFGKYYFNNKHKIFIPYAYEIEAGLEESIISTFSACDAICPNSDSNHKSDTYINLYSSGNGICFYCNICKSQYDIKTGNALNNEAQNKKLSTFRISYDKGNKSYTLSK